MPTIRVKKNNHYATIHNCGLQDPKLSYKARGIYAYLMSLPDDWVINRKHLANSSENNGVSSVRTGLKELRDEGYLVKESKRDEEGKITAWESILYEVPQDKEKEYYKRLKSRRSSQMAENPPGGNPNRKETDNIQNKQKPQSKDCRKEEDNKKIKNEFQKTFNNKPSDNQIKTILGYIDQLSWKVVKYAFKQCRINFAGSPRYLIVVLEDWIENNLCNKDNIKDYIKDHNNSSVRGSNKVNFDDEEDDIEKSNIDNAYFDEIRNKLS